MAARDSFVCYDKVMVVETAVHRKYAYYKKIEKDLFDSRSIRHRRAFRDGGMNINGLECHVSSDDR